MQDTRRERLKAVILEELSMVVPREVKDPRIPSVTFTNAEVAHDGSHATVYVSILANPGGEIGAKRMSDCLTGLASASGFLRRHLAKVLTVRHIPTLAFKEDRGFENTMRVQELLSQLTATAAAPAATTPAALADGSANGSKEEKSG